jgi:glycine oxidase
MPAKGARLMPSVVVIGAGVIGLSVAWRAAQHGLDVTVADPAPGRGASYVAAGMLSPVAEAKHAERELARLGLESLARYPAFTAELTALTGQPTGFRETGTLQVGYDADDVAMLGELRELQESLGRPVRQLTGRECRAMEPMLDPAIRGGLLVTGDGSVDPRLLVPALLAAAQRTGARLIGRQVTEVLSDGGRACGVRLAGGAPVEADWVVLAAGWSSARLGGLPDGAAPPVRPVKGQILRLRSGGGPGGAAEPPLLSRSVRGIIHGSSVYLIPRQDGELVIGATQEELGADLRVTAGGVWELLRDARTLLPGLTELEFAEAIAGLRPGTPDNAPVLGPSGPPGLVLATGHFRNGVLLAPVTADIIAEYLATGQLPAIAAPFTAARFSGVPDGARESRGQP